MTRIHPIVLVLALSLGPLANAGELEDAVARLLAARTPAAKTAAIEGVLALKPDASAVAAALRAGRTYAAAPSGWRSERVSCHDGKARRYHRMVPEGYDPKTPTPVLFDLHGGVSRAAPLTDEQLAGRRAMWETRAAKAGMILIVPSAHKGCEWWSPLGSDMLLRILADTRRTLNVDENRVHLTGFSDGASGSFYMALFHPTVFASAAPLSGHVAVAQAGSRKPIYLPTLRATPLYVVNGTRDRLYPAGQVTPFIDAMKKAGASLTYTAVEAGHDASYLATEAPKVMAFFARHRRTPHPERLTLEALTPARSHWVAIDQLGRVRGESALEDVNVSMRPPLRLGINIDRAYTGAGVKISAITANTLAAHLDLQKGDVIASVDGAALADARGLIAVLRSKRWGDRLTLGIQRAGVALTVSGTFLQPAAQKYLARPRPAGRIDVARAGNLVVAKTRGVRRFRLLLSSEVFDLEQPIDLMVNGRRRSLRATVDVKWMLEQAARDDDRTQVYAAQLVVDVATRRADKGEKRKR